MDNVKLYADVEINSKDFFVVTPEGNYFNFPSTEFDETHDDAIIVDPKSHKIYTVVFNE
mgnify:FL=1|jgi:hypothetical protein